MAKQAKRKPNTKRSFGSVPKHIRAHSQIAEVSVPASKLPDDPGLYALVAEGNCLAPIVENGDHVIISPATTARAGDVVHIAPKEGSGHILKILSNALPPIIGASLAEGSEVRYVVGCEMLNPPQVFFLPAENIASVYPCIGVLRDGRFHPLQTGDGFR